MPKLKTNKAVRKRFKITARKKILYQKTKRRHLLGDKAAGKKRHSRGWKGMNAVMEKRLQRSQPYNY